MSEQFGTVSPCGDAIIGRGGHMFLLNGSNCLHGQYCSSAPYAAKWISLILERRSYCDSMGIDFFQMIIPEKQTVMPDLYPLDKPRITPALLGINSALSTLPSYVNAYDLLSCLYLFKRLDPFRLGDTHLTSRGYIELLAPIVGRYCREAAAGLFHEICFRNGSANGDLKKKFYKSDSGEKLLMPIESLPFFCGSVKCVEFSHGPKLKKSGTVVKFVNSRPRIDKSVLIFGNSMSERGSNPLGLTWWLSRIFKEVAFVWSPSICSERVDIVRPDILISQTVERFLPVVAKA